MRCKCCVAKDETISVLKEQIEWLRLQSGTPTLTKLYNPTDQPEVVPGLPLHLSEEEEEEMMLERARSVLADIGADTNVTIE